MQYRTSQPQKKAAFLDRDGTISADVGYCRRVEDFHLLPDVPQAIRLLNSHGFRVVVITNQSGIARGYFTEETLSLIHRKMQDELSRDGAYLDGIYHCPHQPDDGCPCRKPKPALIRQAAADLNLSLGLSYMIGDHIKDVEAGKAAGCRTVWLNPSAIQAGNAPHESLADHIATDLYQAVQWLTQDAVHRPARDI